MHQKERAAVASLLRGTGGNGPRSQLGGARAAARGPGGVPGRATGPRERGRASAGRPRRRRRRPAQRHTLRSAGKAREVWSCVLED